MDRTEPRNQILLYPPSTDVPSNGLPVPRLDLINESSVTALFCFLSILFPSADERPIYYDHRAMWTVAARSVLATFFRDAADFLGAVESMNAWFVGWASSADRLAPLQPAWAIERGIEEVQVRDFAEAILSELAVSKPQRIRFFGPDGGAYSLEIPSRPALCPPTVESERVADFVFECVDSLDCFQNAFGRRVYVRVRADEHKEAVSGRVKLKRGARTNLIAVFDGVPITYRQEGKNDPEKSE